MNRIDTPLGYPILIGDGLLQDFPIEALPRASRYVVITDENVARLYGEELCALLRSHGLEVHMLTIAVGEESKCREVKRDLESRMFELGCRRDTVILALGGGVVGDLAGFVAATFMRGIGYVHVPTTLLAMVDSSIGGKTGINTEYGKNLLGAIWHPKCIVMDAKVLHDLPEEHVRNGLVEAIKMFLTHDGGALLIPLDRYEEIISRAVQIKTSVVADDEREHGERALLNLGHTVGHALEKLTNYEMFHGYAVGLGIGVEAKMAELSGYLSAEDYGAVEGYMTRVGVDFGDLRQFESDEVEAAMQFDKKVHKSVVRYVVLTGLGEVLRKDGAVVHSLDPKIFRSAWEYFVV